MIEAPLRVIPLAAAHDRTTFDSRSEPLDHYFRLQVTQDVRRRVTVCFVAVTPEQRIAGYYTLASASLLLAELPADMVKKLPRYPSVPAVRMGRLAVDLGFRGQGLGSALQADALDRAARDWLVGRLAQTAVHGAAWRPTWSQIKNRKRS